MFNFNGTCDRYEYWLVWILGCVFYVFALSLFATGVVGVFIGLILCVLMFLQQMATSVCRIRATGQNVMWILAYFLPYIGVITLIVFGCLKSKK